VARLVLLAAAVALVAGGCAERPLPTKVVVICVDGLDWSLAGPLVDAGKMPNLERIAEHGVRVDLRSIARDEMVRSPWLSIAAGRVVRDSESLPAFKEDGTRRPGTETWGARPFWELLGERGMTVGVVNWPYTWPASPVNGWIVVNGLAVAPEDGYDPIPDLAWPPELSADLAGVRRPASATTNDDIAALLNGTEWAVAQSPDIRDRVEDLRLDWAGDQSVLQTATHLLEARGQPDVTVVWFGGLLHMLHPFWGPMRPDTPGVSDSEEIVSTFKDVIPRYCERVDSFIGEILDRTDPATTVVVCSGFGFRGPQRDPDGALRLGADMHSETGLLAAAGPGVARGRAVTDAAVIDVAPTVLALLGVPVPRDMSGFVMRDALAPDLLERRPLTFADAPRREPAPATDDR
jgi:predicted AlkP superfamily phosphohydrolase/phosphomutase